MNRLFAAVAISALALSGAAFAADAPSNSPSLAQSAQAPATTTISPAKPKPAIVKKADSKATTGAVSGAPVTK